MNNFRVWLIHKLGGLTIAESKESDKQEWDTGVYVTLVSLKVFAERMERLNDYLWRKRMTEHILTQLKKMEGGVNHEE